MLRSFRRLLTDTEGAVAPTIGLTLFALIAAGGLAFDYARLAALDTELQQAADMAALVAAGQLDRTSDAVTRAQGAVQASDVTTRLASNLTRFANDGSARAIAIPNLTFCSSFDDSKASLADACDEIDADEPETARFVIATTAVRSANYAFTPIVGALSGSTTASAVAGVESSICNVAPLLVCAPSEDFPTDADIGKGMVMKTSGGEGWAPGNYGYLDFGNGNPAVLAALHGNGLNGCQSEDDNQTEPGNKNATDAINTRMDVYAGLSKNEAANCDPTTGASCPAQNTRKDMTLQMTYTIELPETDPAPTSAPDCGTAATGKGNPNPSLTYSADFAQRAQSRQFGRDTCHYTGSCPVTGGAQNFGDKTWDRAGYLAANHPGVAASTIAAAVGGGAAAATLTRYQVYRWEIANKATGKLDPREVGTAAPPAVASKGNKKTYTFKKQCAFNQARFATAAADTAKDRRVLPVVAANCDELKGKGSAFQDYKILRVFDVFLTEPSLTRSAAETGITGATAGTDEKEIYGEVIGPAQTVSEGGGFQYYARNKPYLIR